MISKLKGRDVVENMNKIFIETADVVGQEYFETLVTSMQIHTKFDYVFIASISDDKRIANILALAANGELQNNFSYELRHTPCEKVLDREYCRYSEDVFKSFPKDLLLDEMNIESYVGYPLLAKGEIPVGILVIMNTSPVKDIDKNFELLKYFARRSELELEMVNLEKELIKSNENLSYANTVRQSILRNLSHELRTPLNAIIGFSELLQSNTLQLLDREQVNEYLKLINNAGLDLLLCIEDLLDFSKIRSKEYPIQKQEFSLNSMIRKCCNEVQQRYRSHELNVTFLQDDVELYNDTHLFKGCIRHILDNAYKHTSQNSKIDVSILRIDSEKIEIKITDNGAGIKSENMSELVKSLTFEEDALTKSKCGLGLGLAYVHHAAELMGLNVKFLSESGVGTTVSLIATDN